jgi:FkbM family methyltransferase
MDGPAPGGAGERRRRRWVAGASLLVAAVVLTLSAPLLAPPTTPADVLTSPATEADVVSLSDSDDVGAPALTAAPGALVAAAPCVLDGAVPTVPAPVWAGYAGGGVCPGMALLSPTRCRTCADPEAPGDTARRLAESAVWQLHLACRVQALPSFVPGRRHFFFDFGAANGNSMDVFLRRAPARTPYPGGPPEPPFLFPTPVDVPPYLFEAYLFEGNPFFNGPLTDYVAALARESPPIVAHAYNGTVAAAADGTIAFYVDHRNPQHNYWGSSVLAEHPDVTPADRIDLPAVDIGALIRRVTCPEDYVVVKMDIEGAEYAIMESWCTRPALWRHIDLLYLEIHRGVKGPTAAQVAGLEPCLAQARALGTIIPPYDSPT